jgi:hypothetical protein
MSVWHGPVDLKRLKALEEFENPDATAYLDVIIEDGKPVSAWIALEDKEHYNPSVKISLTEEPE